MPKSSSKLEFSDSEFVFRGAKFKGSIDMGDGGRERDRDLGGGDRNLGVKKEIWRVETGIWGWKWGSGGGDGDLEGGDGDRGGGKGDLGGWGSLPISPSKENSGREWRGNWYCRGTHML